MADIVSLPSKKKVPCDIDRAMSRRKEFEYILFNSF